ncbi:MAG: hypothetical protein WEA31_02205 [Pirellulales bacterium]
MNFDEQGRLVCSPPELYALAVANPHRLLIGYLMGGTPHVFARHEDYCVFLDAVSDGTGVHPKNLYVRGSCQIGFSIAPRAHKVWCAVGPSSDLDLVIVDPGYFRRCEDELRRWEARNPVRSPQAKGAAAAENRAQDRLFNCFRDKGLPRVVCVHHRKMMEKVAQLAHCGHVRDVSAFIYPDWHSAQERYEFDLRKLCDGVKNGSFIAPPEVPLPR